MWLCFSYSLQCYITPSGGGCRLNSTVTNCSRPSYDPISGGATIETRSGICYVCFDKITIKVNSISKTQTI